MSAGFKQYVDIYAKDQKTFYSDFAAAFQKLEELGRVRNNPLATLPTTL